MEVVEVLLLACEVTTKVLFWGGQALVGWLRRQSKLQGEHDFLRKENRRLKEENNSIYDESQ